MLILLDRRRVFYWMVSSRNNYWCADTVVQLLSPYGANVDWDDPVSVLQTNIMGSRNQYLIVTLCSVLLVTELIKIH